MRPHSLQWSHNLQQPRQQRHLCLLCAPSFRLGLSPDGRQLRFVRWALCIYEPAQTFTSTNHSSGGGGGEGLRLLSGCPRPGCRLGTEPGGNGLSIWRHPLSQAHLLPRPSPTPPTSGIKIEAPKAQPVDLFSSPSTLEWMPSVYAANAHLFLYPDFCQPPVLTASGPFHVGGYEASQAQQ